MKRLIFNSHHININIHVCKNEFNKEQQRNEARNEENERAAKERNSIREDK
jgi:hypothetical protein